MADDADELERLAAADPAAHAAAADVRSPDAVALFERITMTDNDTDTDTRATFSRRRAPALLGAAALLVAVLGGVVLLSDDDDRTDAALPTSTTEATAAPISPGGPSTASCVETYDLTTLGNRELAFAGTVEAVDGDNATFTVERWFRGGTEESITLTGAAVLGGVTSARDAVLAPGARLLVAGDGGFAWACGFTQVYRDQVAEDWAAVFGND